MRHAVTAAVLSLAQPWQCLLAHVPYFEQQDLSAEAPFLIENIEQSKAVYAHLDHDLSSPVVPGRTGRHPLPDPAEMATRLGGWGIGPGTQVVVYDDMVTVADAGNAPDPEIRRGEV